MRLLTANIALVCLLSPAFGEPQQPNERQTVIVGPWNINTTYKGDKFDNCTMARSASGMDIAFIRNQDGLLLTLDSPKWKLERGKAYTVRLSAAGRSAEAKALAERRSDHRVCGPLLQRKAARCERS